MTIVREVEQGEVPFEQIRRKYGIRGCDTVQGWVRLYGNGSRGKVIRVEKAEEINELKKFRERVKRLEKALADATLELQVEKAYTQLACERAGIQDVAEFKKKAAGPQRT